MELCFTLEKEEEEEEGHRPTFYAKSRRRSISSVALSEVTSPEKTHPSAPTSKKKNPPVVIRRVHPCSQDKRGIVRKEKKRMEINFLMTFVQQVVPTFRCSSGDAKEGDLLLHENMGKPEGQVYHQR